MITLMPTTARPQQRYDHRLRNLVHRTGNVTVATNLGVPRSTARGWLGAAPSVVVCLDVADLTEPELRQEVLKLRRRVQKLTALLRLVLAVLRTSGFRRTEERLPDGRDKIRILRAVDRARAFVPLRALLRFLRVSPSRFHAWRRRQQACALDDQSSCPRTSPSRLTPPEVRAIQDMVTSPDYRHVPTGTLAVLAQRLGTVWASPSTWYRLVRQHGWRRPRAERWGSTNDAVVATVFAARTSGMAASSYLECRGRRSRSPRGRATRSTPRGRRRGPSTS
jgi:putative transposase